MFVWVCLKGAFIECWHEDGKKIYFNDSSGYGDTQESDADDEAECVTEENEIRAVYVMDAVNSGSSAASYLTADSFKMSFSAMLLMLLQKWCLMSITI